MIIPICATLVVCMVVGSIAVFGGEPSAWSQFMGMLRHRAEVRANLEIEKKRLDLKMLEPPK